MNTMIKFIETLAKFISESHTVEITYVRLVAISRLTVSRLTLTKTITELDCTTEKLNLYI